MPLILDTINRLAKESFVSSDIQEGLSQFHRIAMPRETVDTLLRRATRLRYLRREIGRYYPLAALPRNLNIAVETDRLRLGQEQLATALQEYGLSRSVTFASADEALAALFKFMEDSQVAVLLGDNDERVDDQSPGGASTVVAEFIQHVLRNDPELKLVLSGILEGLVLYHAAFLPDLDATGAARFKDLEVFLDSDLVRQLLGYEGEAMQTLLSETIALLKGEGIKCSVFDKTIQEIRNILDSFEGKIGTSAGRRSLGPSPMARHFLTAGYSRGDIRQMRVLLENDIRLAGLGIRTVPKHIPEYTWDEKSLAVRLTDPRTNDRATPRINHDVDCVAAVLTLRRGKVASSLEQTRFIFVSSSNRVIQNTRLWYEIDEKGPGVPPLIHIRALTNLAWIKKPKMCAGFKEQELIALCAAALRPSTATWQRFLKYLSKLETDRKITSDEITMILISGMSDSLIKEAERYNTADQDVASFGETVAKVKAQYSGEAEARVRQMERHYSSTIEELSRDKQIAAENDRRRELKITNRARSSAAFCARVVRWFLTLIAVVAGASLISERLFNVGVIGILVGSCVIIFIGCETLGVLSHVSDLQSNLENRLYQWFRSILTGETASN